MPLGFRKRRSQQPLRLDDRRTYKGDSMRDFERLEDYLVSHQRAGGIDGSVAETVLGISDSFAPIPGHRGVYGLTSGGAGEVQRATG